MVYSQNILVSLGVFLVLFGLTFIWYMKKSNRKMNEAVENFTIAFEQDVKTIIANKKKFELLPESLRVIIFIEIANSIKLLMR